MHIIGAGMAGCLAAILNPTAIIFEGSESRPDNHKAVLRFRTNKISEITGIPFEEIRVHKSIFYKNKFHSECNPFFSNSYSMKVIGKISDRSIWNLEESTRYIAPSNFHELLLERLEKEGRVKYGENVVRITKDVIKTNLGTYDRDGSGVISTMPMKFMPSITDVDFPAPIEFSFNEIVSLRATVEDSDVHQTIYYPDPESAIYRATLTGDNLIIETRDWDSDMGSISEQIESSFGISCRGNFENHVQKFGKIATIDNKVRKQYISWLTDELDIYSLGRFAIWKNVLLDDVLEDLYVIQRLVQSDGYERKLIRR